MSQSKLILYLIIVLGLLGGFFYNGQLDPTANILALPPGVNPNDLNTFRTLRINYTVVEDPAFRTLQIFGPFPVPSAAPGRDNPFSR